MVEFLRLTGLYLLVLVFRIGLSHVALPRFPLLTPIIAPFAVLESLVNHKPTVEKGLHCIMSTKKKTATVLPKN